MKCSSDNLLTPYRISSRIFSLINAVRAGYKQPPLVLDNTLSILAGEHACQMSTGQVPLGHADFSSRHAKVPMALTFSENVAKLENPGNDPAQEFIVYWLSKSCSLARILSAFTHTGIGVSESETGEWYCTQIFASFKKRLSRKDELWIVGNFINGMRCEREIERVSFSLSATAQLRDLIMASNEASLGLQQTRIRAMFHKCQEAEFILENVATAENSIELFIEQLKEHSSHRCSIRNKLYTEMAFASKRLSKGVTACVLIFGAAKPHVYTIPKIDTHFPVAAKCCRIINDYRVAHNMKPLELVHTWCRVAQKYADSMMNHEKELDHHGIESVIKKHQPKAKVRAGVCMCPAEKDPLMQIVLIWISRRKSRMNLLSESDGFGVAVSEVEGKMCCAVRVVGVRDVDNPPKPVDGRVPFDPKESCYLCLTDGEDDFIG